MTKKEKDIKNIFEKRHVIKKKDVDKQTTIILCKTPLFYDILIMDNNINYLKYIQKKYKNNAHIIKKSIFNKPVFVLDTCDKGITIIDRIKNGLFIRKYFKKICKEIKNDKTHINSLTLFLNDVTTNKRYEINIDGTWFAFPGLQQEGCRLEVFYKKKNAKYGEFNHDLPSIIIDNGELKLVHW